MSTTLLQMEQLVSEAIGDYLEFDTTTNIGAGTSVISTTLQSYDGGQNDYFNDWWVYITEGNNIAVLRQVSDYATASGTLTVRGANLAAEAGAVTCRLHRFNRDSKKRAINRALDKLYPTLHKRIDNMSLITGQHLPDNEFDSWSSSTALTWYTTSNVTLARTTTAGLARRGAYCAKATASAGNGYFYVTSNSFPRLLDLMEQTVTFKCWVYPEVADDAWIQIYTVQADGTAQTLTSTTTCPAGKYTLLELEDQTLNDDLVEVQFRFGITTNAKYAYFCSPRVIANELHEYLLPDPFQDGHVSQCLVQMTGFADDMCDDLHPRFWDEQEFRVRDDGTYKYIYLSDLNTTERRVRLYGYTPFDNYSADTDTIPLEGVRLNLIVAQSAINLYEMEQGPVSSQDKGRYAYEIGRWRDEFRRIVPHLTMTRPADRLYTGI